MCLQSHPQCVEAAVCVPVVLEAGGYCVETRKRRRAERHLLRNAGQVPHLSSNMGMYSVVPTVSLQYRLRSVSVSLQYSVDSAAPQYISISELCQSLRSNCWSVSLSSLLPPGGSSLTRSEINTALSWSFNTVSSDPSNGDSLR